MPSAEARIEAKFNDRSENPDSDGSRTVEVDIMGDGLSKEEIEEIDYVRDVIDLETEFKVFVSASRPGPSVSSV